MPEFVPLHAALRALPDEPAVDEPSGQSPPIPAEPDACEEEASAVISEIRRFRAAVADAFDYEVRELLRDVAATVLARELLLSPADIATIVEESRSRFTREAVLAVRVHPTEMELLASLDVDVFPDPALRRGDVAIDLRSGSIDLSLGARLEAMLSR
jgi:flagellar biosynthesis/type III secretory pathway protein FliH